MLTVKELLEQVDRLPTAEKWQLVRQLLRSLEREQSENRRLGNKR
jgi:hypothetical protein